MNDYSRTSIEKVSKIYKDFITKEYDVAAVAIGGSAARGYACPGSDIDILYFCKNQKSYQKRFETFEDINIEIHYIPIIIPELLYNMSLPLIKESAEIAVSPIDLSILGEKKCEKYIGGNDCELDKVLSAWRELSKMFDTVILYQDGDWYEKAYRAFHKIAPDKACIVDLLFKYRAGMDAVSYMISILKLGAIYNNKVYSKVLWTDHYLNENPKSEIKYLIHEIVKPINKIPDEWLSQADNGFRQLSRQHAKISCSTCQGNIIRCNIGRCANDYLNDTKRAIESNYIIGALLSLKKAVDYSNKAAKTNNFPEIVMPGDWYDFWKERNLADEELFERLIKISFGL